jgi:hypothetical protein
MVKQQKKLSVTFQDRISWLITNCKNEPNKDKRIEILNRINSTLLAPDQLNIDQISPLSLTNNHIDILLNRIEAKLMLV